jgi:DUF971 family protein
MAVTLEQASVIGNEMALAFGDGSELYLPLPMLRRACPCAVCQGEPDAMGRVVKPQVEHGPRAFELVRFEVVGGYALQLHWADGHAYGIYTFPYLMKLGALGGG